MDLEEKRIGGTHKYRGRIVNVRVDDIALPTGKPAVREVVEHPGGVTVLPLDEKGNIIMVRQWRYPFMEQTLEVPAGKLDAGEDPYQCGLRELKEETGLSTGDYVSLGCIYPSPGYSDETLYLYLAQKLRAGQSRPDEDEFLSVERYPFDRVVQMIMDDEIRDAKTIAAVLKTKVLLHL